MLFLLSVALASCDLGGSTTATVPYITELDVWVPSGSVEEGRLMQEQALRFNQSHEDVRINMVILPPGDYHEQLRLAVTKQTLPDMMRMPAEWLYTFAWQEHLLPLDKLLTDAVSEDLLPVALQQGMYQGRLYGVTPLLNRPLLYARRSQLPMSLATEFVAALAEDQSAEAMSYRRFSALLAALSRVSNHSAVLEIQQQPLGLLALMNMNWPQDELAVAELQQQDKLQSLFNQPALIQLVQTYQQWLVQGYISSDSHSVFMAGGVPLLLASQREARTLQSRWHDDLMLLAAPHTAQQQPVLMADWFWSLRRHGEKQAAAIRYLEFLLQAEEVRLMAQASSLLPATVSAGQDAGDTEYQLAVNQTGHGFVLRTPAYAELRKTFDLLFQQLTVSASVVQVLRQSQEVFRQHWLARELTEQRLADENYRRN